MADDKSGKGGDAPETASRADRIKEAIRGSGSWDAAHGQPVKAGSDPQVPKGLLDTPAPSASSKDTAPPSSQASDGGDK
jgi:hypothetical protein